MWWQGGASWTGELNPQTFSRGGWGRTWLLPPSYNRKVSACSTVREIINAGLLQALPLVQSLPVGCSPHYYDNSHLLLPPGTPAPTILYTNPAQGGWTIPTLTSSRDK